MEKYIPWLKGLAVFVVTAAGISVLDVIRDGGKLDQHVLGVAAAAGLAAVRAYLAQSPFPASPPEEKK